MAVRVQAKANEPLEKTLRRLRKICNNEGITREVKRRFDLEGLSVPFPRRELHIYEERELDRAPRDSQVAPAMSAE